MVDGTEHSTVHSAVPSFEKWLSHEDKESVPETQPESEVQTPEPVEAEATPEEANAEGDSAETPDTAEEQTEETEEAPASVPLDLTSKVKVTINGVETEVTLDEALKGYSRQADYTRKTQEISASKKAFETEAAAVRVERQKYASYLTQLEQAIQQNSAAEPNWPELQKSLPPEEFAAEYARWQIHANEMATLKAEKERANAAVAKDQQKELENHLAAESEKLLTAIPEWKVEATATAERAKIVAYAEKAFGLTLEDLGKLVDHRPIVMLRKAMLFDELQAKKPVVQARIEKVRTATPGPAAQAPRKVTEETKSLQRLAKTGKVEDAAAAFFQMLP